MTKLLNRLSEELYELRELINDEDYHIKTVEYQESKFRIKNDRLSNKIMFKKEELTDEEDKLYKEINENYIQYDCQKLQFEKRRLEALKKYLKEQEEKLTDLIRLNLI